LARGGAQATGAMTVQDVYSMYTGEKRQKVLLEKKFQLAQARVDMLELVSTPCFPRVDVVYQYYRYITIMTIIIL
jgi:hypothetical protein